MVTNLPDVFVLKTTFYQLRICVQSAFGPISRWLYSSSVASKCCCFQQFEINFFLNLKLSSIFIFKMSLWCIRLSWAELSRFSNALKIIALSFHLNKYSNPHILFYRIKSKPVLKKMLMQGHKTNIFYAKIKINIYCTSSHPRVEQYAKKQSRPERSV